MTEVYPGVYTGLYTLGGVYRAIPTLVYTRHATLGVYPVVYPTDVNPAVYPTDVNPAVYSSYQPGRVSLLTPEESDECRTIETSTFLTFRD